MLLLAHPQYECLHATNDHIGRERIERGTIDFPVMANFRHQWFGTAHQASQYIAMATEKLGSAMNNHIHAQRQRVLIQGGGKGIVRHHQGADALGRRYKAFDIDYFQRRIGGCFQVEKIAAFGDFPFDLFMIECFA